MTDSIKVLRISFQCSHLFCFIFSHFSSPPPHPFAHELLFSFTTQTQFVSSIISGYISRLFSSSFYNAVQREEKNKKKRWKENVIVSLHAPLSFEDLLAPRIVSMLLGRRAHQRSGNGKQEKFFIVFIKQKQQKWTRIIDFSARKAKTEESSLNLISTFLLSCVCVCECGRDTSQFFFVSQIPLFFFLQHETKKWERRRECHTISSFKCFLFFQLLFPCACVQNQSVR